MGEVQCSCVNVDCHGTFTVWMAAGPLTCCTSSMAAAGRRVESSIIANSVSAAAIYIQTLIGEEYVHVLTKACSSITIDATV